MLLPPNNLFGGELNRNQVVLPIDTTVNLNGMTSGYCLSDLSRPGFACV